METTTMPSQHMLQLQANRGKTSDVTVSALPVIDERDAIKTQNVSVSAKDSTEGLVSQNNLQLKSSSTSSHMAAQTNTTTFVSYNQMTGKQPQEQMSRSMIREEDEYRELHLKAENGEKIDLKVKKKADWLLSGVFSKEDEQEEDALSEEEAELERKSTRKSTRSSKSTSSKRKSSPEARRWEERY